jgi:ligand-binding SRPBCC domain-containing protein
MGVDITKKGRGYLLSADLTLPRPPEQVFAFFADAANLEQITPPQLRFKILTPGPLVMREGLLIDYRLRVRGLGVRWQSQITVWDPPRRFVDVQRRGPYRRWVHEHRFIDLGGSTRVEDRVEYQVPGGPIVHRMLVARDLRRIFNYRVGVLEERFGAITGPT